MVDYFDAPADDFRLRAEAALTHPATLLALAALLVNDHLLKSIWPGAWATGKLSDLAWLIFAMPLAAWLLSLIARDGRLSRRVAFISAYLGLPLLYAAFNTFGSLHDFILTAITTPFGLNPGSPLDATDSIVIPPAMAIGLWVWRANSAKSALARRKWVILVATLAIVASIATTESPKKLGIIEVAVTDNGFVIAQSGSEYGDRSGLYQSQDGGLTWGEERNTESPLLGVGDRAETPRGTYLIADTDIVKLGPQSESEVVYSTAYLTQSGNQWIQRISTIGLGNRELAERPLSIVYNAKSDNLVVAMGIQGVLVGMPDEQWIRVRVGSYSPTDYSFWRKGRILMRSLEYWTGALLLSFAMVGLALLLANRSAKSLISLPFELAAGIGFVATLVAILLLTSDRVLLITVLIAFLTTFLMAGYGRTMPSGSRFRRFIATTLVTLTVGVSIVVIVIFDDFNDGVEGVLWIVFVMPAFLLCIPMFVMTWDRREYMLPTIPIFVAMNAAVFLSHIVWLNTGVEKISATILAVLLTTVIAVISAIYLRSKFPPLDIPPANAAAEPEPNS